MPVVMIQSATVVYLNAIVAKRKIVLTVWENVRIAIITFATTV